MLVCQLLLLYFLIKVPFHLGEYLRLHFSCSRGADNYSIYPPIFTDVKLFSSSFICCEFYCVHIIKIFFPLLGQSLFLLIAIKKSVMQTHVVDDSLKHYYRWWAPLTCDNITGQTALIIKQNLF